MSKLDRKSRRNFLASGLGAAAIGGVALAQQTGTGTGVIPAAPTGSPFNAGDNAILRFSLAAEILAADIWSQMADAIAGDSAFAQAAAGSQGLMPQVIRDIARDEQSHAAFLSAFATQVGMQDPLPFDTYRTLPTYSTIGSGTNGSVFAGTGMTTGSKAPSGRLVNLTNLNIDTSFYYKYRSSLNPDVNPGQIFQNTFAQIVNLSGQAVIPGNYTQNQQNGNQNTGGNLYTPVGISEAALLFGSQMEQQEGSTYLALGQNITDPEMALAMASIMPVEMMHYTALQAVLAQMISNANNCSAGSLTPSNAGGTGGTTSGSGSTGSGGNGSGTGTGTGTGGTSAGSLTGSAAACWVNPNSSGGSTTSGTGGTGSGGDGNGGTGSTGTGSTGAGSTGSTPATTNGFTSTANGGFFFNNLQGAGAGPESILPAPAPFRRNLPPVSIVRPGRIGAAGATVLVRSMIRMGLLQGQPAAFTDQLLALAAAADAAVRQCAATNSNGMGTGSF